MARITGTGVDTSVFANRQGAYYDSTLTKLKGLDEPGVNVLTFGAKGDGKVVTDAAITSGAAVLTSATATFTAADVGKLVVVQGAGAAAASLATTISAFTNATTVTLAANAGTTVSAAEAIYGSDDQAAIQAACDALATSGGLIDFPARRYMLATRVTVSGGITLRGTGIDYAGVDVAPNRGAILCAGTAMATGIVALGTTQTNPVRSGDAGASMWGMVVDAANLAVYGIRTLQRRNYIMFCQAYRATTNAVRLEGQNGYLLSSVIGNNNVGSPVYVTNADNKIIGNQIRQGAVAQLEAVAVDDLLVANNHIFGGAFGSLTGTTGNDIRVTGTSSRVTIVNNVLDGTFDHHVLLKPASGQTINYVNIADNLFWQVAGGTSSTSGAVKIDTSASGTAAVRIVTVDGNLFSGLDLCWTAIIDSSGASGPITSITETNNSGFGHIATYVGARPAVVDNNLRRTAGGVDKLSNASGRATLNGTGAQTAFTIAHGIDGTPASVFVTPGAAAAAALFYATADGTNITVTFTAAPASGTSNVVLNWRAEL